MTNPPFPSPQEYRRSLNAAILAVEARTTPVGHVEDIRISGPGSDLPLRLYHPEGAGRQPLTLYLHGAGFVAGSLETHDNVCRYLCAGVPCVVAAVDYRLAPEAHFPTALEDAYAALLWAAGHGAEWGADASRLAVAGDSAGGNLAAAIALLARDRQGPPLSFQLLVNPMLDMTRYDVEGAEELAWFRDQYVRSREDWRNPYVSPALAEELRGLPPAFILTGEQDLLREEGERYARRLCAAGVFVNVYCQRGKGHLGSRYARAAREAREALDLSVVVLRAAFGL